MFFDDLFYTGAGIVGLLIALIPLIITIALIVAIFQINSRIADLIKLQQHTNTHLSETAELQRQTLIAQLAEVGPNHKEYLDYLVDLDYLTQYQADFVLKQSGNDDNEGVKSVDYAATQLLNDSTDSAFLDLVQENSPKSDSNDV